MRDETSTPGPWFASETLDDDYGYKYCTVGPFQIEHEGCNHVEDTICEVRGINHDATANARLIAAAPELLAVLRDLEWIGMNDGRGVTRVMCPACSALKSRGSGHNHHCGLAAALRKAGGSDD